MKLNTTSTLEVYQFENLLNEPGIHHCITTRKGGISEGYADSLNLGMGVEDHIKYVEENRRRLAEFMGVPPNRLIFQKQTHSNNYKIITEKNFTDTIMNNDALITAETGIALAALGADCVPVLLYDKKNKVIASIHAGWKGTVNGIVNEVLNVFKNEFNSVPENIIAGIGPSISAKNYEVGPEVIEAFEKAFSNADQLISNRHDNKAHVDLWLGNKTWLINQGVPEKNIEISGLCTYDNSDTFFSARYSKNKTGRFGGCIVLK
jgi:YfiH family protein